MKALLEKLQEIDTEICPLEQLALIIAIRQKLTLNDNFPIENLLKQTNLVEFLKIVTNMLVESIKSGMETIEYYMGLEVNWILSTICYGS